MSLRRRVSRAGLLAGVIAGVLTGPLAAQPRAVQIASGEEFSCLRAADGSVWCWGENSFGARALPIRPRTAAPRRATQIPGVTGAVDLVVDPLLGGCARTATGAFTCWGDALLGRLGNGRSDLAPGVASAAGLRDVTQGATRGRNGCALRADRTVQCWGENLYGQVGDGTREERRAPTTVRGLSAVAEIALGFGGACARMVDGTVRCWGWDWSQVGNASALGAVTTPREVAGLRNARALWAGDYQMFVATSDGALLAFGAGDHGMLGDARMAHERTINHAAPTRVAGVRGVTQLAAGRRHACVVTSSGAVWCWGTNPAGQRGDGTVGTDETRELQHLPGGDVTCLRRHPDTPLEGCLPLSRGGAVLAYGAPSRVVGLPPARQVAVGAMHSCAVTRAGEVWCWGAGDVGQLGGGEALRRPRAARVAGLEGVEEVALGRTHSCARTRDGRVSCWGLNSAGQLGVDGPQRRATPAPIVTAAATAARPARRAIGCAPRDAARGARTRADRATRSDHRGTSEARRATSGSAPSIARARAPRRRPAARGGRGTPRT